MLTATVRLRFGIFDAGDASDPRRPEWPPHPARLFCALVAGDPEPHEWEALRWLEAQPPPEVHAPDALDETAHEQYLVNNLVGGNNPNTPGRSPGIRIKPRIVPATNRFAVVWPTAEPTASTLAALQALAWRVPYVGRSTSDAEVTITTGAPSDDIEVAVFEPVAVRDARVNLRAPYPGYSDELAAAHEDGRSAWEVGRPFGYRSRPVERPMAEPPQPSPFSELVPLAVVGGSQLHGSHTLVAADALRNTAMVVLDRERSGDLPAALSGHGADGRNHVAFIGLPNVGIPATLPGLPDYRFRASNTQADGRILGLAIGVPADDPEARGAVARLLVERGDEPLRLTLGRDGVLDVGRPGTPRPWAVVPARWTQPSRLWATATPLMLDRFPKRNDSPSAMIMDAFETAGYPRPIAVHVQRSPLVPGGIHLRRSRVQRRAGAAVRPWFHAWAAFDQPIAGPVLVGSLRYRGVGLFAPLPEPSLLDDDRSRAAAPAEEVET